MFRKHVLTWVAGCLVLSVVFGLCMWNHLQQPSYDPAVFELYLRCVFSDDFGYTLVGAKPASLDDSWISTFKKFYPEEVRRADDFLRTEFAQSDEFILRELHGSRWLIHKKSMLRQIERYPELKAFVNKKFGDKRTFFDHIQHSKKSLFKILGSKSILISIALGYGRDNGKMYLRRVLVGEYLQKYPIVSIYPFEGIPGYEMVRDFGWLFCMRMEKIEKPRILPQFSSLEEEWDWIQENEWKLHEHAIPKPPYYLVLPMYASCKSREAKQVHAKFLRGRSRLARLFCQMKPSEAIAHVASKRHFEGVERSALK